MREKRSDEILTKAADEHLHYEFVMLINTHNLIPLRQIQENDNLRNAIIEAQAIHMRVLFNFFFPNNPRPSDMIAEDYYDDPEIWRKYQKGIADSKEISKIRKRVNKEIAHLTYDRLDLSLDQKSWRDESNYAYNLIIKTMRQFLKTVSRDRIGPKMKAPKKELAIE